MCPRATLVLAAALVPLLCQPLAAKVVRDGKTSSSSPAVEAGGFRLAPQPPPSIPYSLIGAIAGDGYGSNQCAAPLPWQMFAPMPFRHHPMDFFRFRRPLPDRGRWTDWSLPPLP